MEDGFEGAAGRVVAASEKDMYDGKYVLVPMEPRRENNLKEAPERATNDDIRGHPMWVRLRDTIMRALTPFAEARAALVLALDEAVPATSP